jgi:hypothetical protein
MRQTPGTRRRTAARWHRVGDGGPHWSRAAGFSDLWIVDANNGRDTGVTVQSGTGPTIILDCAVTCRFRGGSGGGGQS